MYRSAVIETDALVVGAGPVGLWCVFELGLLGIATHVVDALDEAGGQCVELYADKPIYDIPGVARCTGHELTQRLLQQAQPFAPVFHFGQQVSGVKRQPDCRWQVTTRIGHQAGQSFLTRTLFIAAGVGAFLPRELKLDGLDAFLGRQLFYRIRQRDDCTNHNVVIVGGEDDAVASALALASAGPQQARRVTLVHRRDVLQASDADLVRLAALREAGQIDFVAGQVSGFETRQTDGVDILMALHLDTPDGGPLTLPVDTILVQLGISPKLGPIADWGLAMQRKQLSVDLQTFATSEAGIFAMGDIVTYPGKKKLIVCGFHEATLAAFAAAELLFPEQSGVLQYTTSSALLQRRLGVETSA